MKKGVVTVEFTAWCNSCGDWERVTARNLTEAIRAFRSTGWLGSTRSGWACPHCAAQGGAR